jgi:hypothetical protein
MTAQRPTSRPSTRSVVDASQRMDAEVTLTSAMIRKATSEFRVALRINRPMRFQHHNCRVLTKKVKVDGSHS